MAGKYFEKFSINKLDDIPSLRSLDLEYSIQPVPDKEKTQEYTYNKKILEKAYEKLYDLTQERDKALEHKTAKLSQLRNALDEGTTTDKIQQMKVYLKVVNEKLAEKQGNEPAEE